MPLDTMMMRTRREEIGWSQDEAGRQAGFLTSRNRWRDIESGAKMNVTIETLEQIAKCLKLEPAELLTSKGKRK